MKREKAKPLVVTCPKCGHENVFNQPYKYHAGFGNQGFLYNDAGNCTLTWGSYDPDYIAIVGQVHPWTLGPKSQRKLEAALKPSPKGDRWLFSNPARCLKCSHPISQPITGDIYYLEYAGSVDVEPTGRAGPGLKTVMK